jgi:hypothetical protein
MRLLIKKSRIGPALILLTLVVTTNIRLGDPLECSLFPFSYHPSRDPSPSPSLVYGTSLDFEIKRKYASLRDGSSPLLSKKQWTEDPRFERR